MSQHQLIDPHDAAEESLDLVRRRITAVLWVVTTIHGLLGAIGAAYAIGPERRGDQIILLLVSIPLAIIIHVVTMLLLRRPPFAPTSLPWLVLLLLPCVGGFLWIL